MSAEPTDLLTRYERIALELGRSLNERPLPKRLSLRYLIAVTRAWVRHTIGPRLYVEGLEATRALAPDRGVMFVANHRSFFDMYCVMLAMFWGGAGWVRRIFFPVRSNFFYEQPLGMVINLAIGGYSMYPPIFRDPSKNAFTQQSVDTVIRLLGEPGVLVGMHPEGTRGKGNDPYELLPAQPGVGQMILAARPIVVPVFYNGIGNNIVKETIITHRPSLRRERPAVLVFGKPIDYSEFLTSKPRAALYKKTADFVRAEIMKVGERERELRAAIGRGELDDSPDWLYARTRARGL